MKYFIFGTSNRVHSQDESPVYDTLLGTTDKPIPSEQYKANPGRVQLGKNIIGGISPDGLIVTSPAGWIAWAAVPVEGDHWKLAHSDELITQADE